MFWAVEDLEGLSHMLCCLGVFSLWQSWSVLFLLCAGFIPTFHNKVFNVQWLVRADNHRTALWVAGHLYLGYI